MKKSTPDLKLMPPDSEPPFEPKSDSPYPMWKPGGPKRPPPPNHPNYPAFLEETAAMVMAATEMEMDFHGQIAQDFMAENRTPPFTLRQTLFYLTAMSLGSEMLAALAKQHRQAMSSRLVGPEGRPL